jgi:hypothetical protein
MIIDGFGDLRDIRRRIGPGKRAEKQRWKQILQPRFPLDDHDVKNAPLCRNTSLGKMPRGKSAPILVVPLAHVAANVA